MSTTIKAVQYTEYGDASVLKAAELPKPSPQPHEVLIKVAAIGTNPVDWKLRQGYIPVWPHAFPIVPGWDVAGTIESAPEGSEFKVGDKVFSYTRPAFDMVEEYPTAKDEKIDASGTYAEYVAVAEWKVAKIPTSASLAQAASIPLAGLTAYQALHDHLKIQKGERVLILGASGGVGSFAVGIAKAAGAYVIGTCSGRNVDYVKGLGADLVVDYTKEQGVVAQVGDKVDKVFDCVGGDSTKDGVDALKEGGIISSIANGEGAAKLAADSGKTGSGFLVKPSAAQLNALAKLLDNGDAKYPTVTTSAFNAENAVAAHKALESARTQGKLVLVVGEQ
eukprot:TRINITY_DN952_c0_g1_i3.p1 TRINITY_DN952_c0_g1~~TRINITY_DN952_c0_g1_i3.p1  ORF type:complete len:344 (-),score=107.22 TRINITY_DN952_c0_g1_i3:87-1091(-)